MNIFLSLIFFCNLLCAADRVLLDPRVAALAGDARELFNNYSSTEAEGESTDSEGYDVVVVIEQPVDRKSYKNTSAYYVAKARQKAQVLLRRCNTERKRLQEKLACLQKYCNENRETIAAVLKSLAFLIVISKVCYEIYIFDLPNQSLKASSIPVDESVWQAFKRGFWWVPGSSWWQQEAGECVDSLGQSAQMPFVMHPCLQHMAQSSACLKLCDIPSAQRNIDLCREHTAQTGDCNDFFFQAFNYCKQP